MERNVTKARDIATGISIAKKSLAKWEAKGKESFVEKYTKKIAELESSEKQGLFIVIGKTFPHKDALKSAGFKFSGCGTWYSLDRIEISIDGLEVIEG